MPTHMYLQCSGAKKGLFMLLNSCLGTALQFMWTAFVVYLIKHVLRQKGTLLVYRFNQ